MGKIERNLEEECQYVEIVFVIGGRKVLAKRTMKMETIECCLYWDWMARIERRGGKTSVCTGIRDGSETSLNTVVHENDKVYKPVCEFFLNFFQFFQKLLSTHIFINCTNLSKFVKFVKIVFDTYSNFIKLSNIF